MPVVNERLDQLEARLAAVEARLTRKTGALRSDPAVAVDGLPEARFTDVTRQFREGMPVKRVLRNLPSLRILVKGAG